MALEIKELKIKINVVEKASAIKNIENQELSQSHKKEIVKECVDKVLEILESKLER